MAQQKRPQGVIQPLCARRRIGSRLKVADQATIYRIDKRNSREAQLAPLIVVHSWPAEEIGPIQAQYQPMGDQRDCLLRMGVDKIIDAVKETRLGRRCRFPVDRPLLRRSECPPHSIAVVANPSPASKLVKACINNGWQRVSVLSGSERQPRLWFAAQCHQRDLAPAGKFGQGSGLPFSLVGKPPDTRIGIRVLLRMGVGNEIESRDTQDLCSLTMSRRLVRRQPFP